MSSKNRQLDPRKEIHQQSGWLETILEYISAHGGTGFRDREGHIVLLTRSAKQAGKWQATWFKSAGPYTDRLDPDARRLLLDISPQLRFWLAADQIDSALERLLGLRRQRAYSN